MSVKKLRSIGLIAGIAGLLAITLVVVPDRRGWTPGNVADPSAIVVPTRLGGDEFTVRECLPGSIIPYAPPDGRDGASSATRTVLTCRSRSGFASIMAVALGLSALLFFGTALIGRRVTRP